LEERLRLLAPVTAEMGVEQVDHGPEVAAFLHVDLEEIAGVVEEVTGAPEMAVLRDGGGPGVPLGDDEATEGAAVLARHLLPRGLPLVVAEVDLPSRLGLGEEGGPPVLGHAGRIR